MNYEEIYEKAMGHAPVTDGTKGMFDWQDIKRIMIEAQQQVKSGDLADVGGSLLSDVVTKMDDGNYMISLIDGNKSYATYADNLPEMFERLADAFRAMEDVEQ